MNANLLLLDYNARNDHIIIRFEDGLEALSVCLLQTVKCSKFINNYPNARKYIILTVSAKC